MSQKNQSNIFKDFNTSHFKKELPPKNDSEKTKEELEYLSTIDLDKKFFQDKDDLIGNFFDFLDDEKVKYDKKQLRKIVLDAVDVILELKNHFKRPRPFKLDHDFKDPLVKSTKGYSYPSGHSTQSNLLSLVLSDLYPKYKKDFDKIVDELELNPKIETIFVIGGENVYKQALQHPKCEKIYLNLVQAECDLSGADAFFPDIDLTQYGLVETTIIDPTVTSCVYKRL